MAAEFYDLTLQRGRRPAFDAAPARHRRRVHATRAVQQRLQSEAQLQSFITRAN